MKAFLGLFFLLFLSLPSDSEAQVPQIINYQGRVVVGTTNFDGAGQFKFALVNGNGSITYWSNDGSSTAGSQPTSAVTLTVTKGLYSVSLGDTSLTNMTAVPANIFTNSDVRLRVWFNDNANGFQLLTPDQRITAVGYAMVANTAQSVPAGAITSTNIAAGAVGSSQLAPSITLSGTVTAGNFNGNGSALTGLSASNVSGGTLSPLIVGVPRLGLDANGTALQSSTGSYVGQPGLSRDGFFEIWNGTNWTTTPLVLGMPVVYLSGGIINENSQSGQATNNFCGTIFNPSDTSGNHYLDNVIQINNNTTNNSGGYGFSAIVFGYHNQDVIPQVGTGEVAMGIPGGGPGTGGGLFNDSFYIELQPNSSSFRPLVYSSGISDENTQPMHFLIEQDHFGSDHNLYNSKRFEIDGSGNIMLNGYAANTSIVPSGIKVLPSGRILVDGATDDGTSALQVKGNINLNGNAVLNGCLMTANTTGTITFNTSLKAEAIYNTSSSTIASATITLPATSTPGQPLRYVGDGPITTVTMSGTVDDGSTLTTLAAHTSVAWQCTTSGHWIRIQ